MPQEWIKRLVWLLLIFGAALRLGGYLANRSLWLDEALLAGNILDRSFAELTQPLGGNQNAPIGFLFLEKAAVNAFGTSEYVLRLLPVLSSLAALGLFYALARRCLKTYGVLIALSFFAFSAPLVRSASQVKQYSTETALALAAVTLGLWWRDTGYARKWSIAAALGGSVMMWLSHGAIFVLGALGLWLFILTLAERRWRDAALIAAVGAVWLASFLAEYFLFLRLNYAASPNNMQYWSNAFAPLPASWTDVKWYYDNLVLLFVDPVGLSFPLVGALLFLLGAALFIIFDRCTLALLLGPLALALVASICGKYPFGQRLLQFGVYGPILILGGTFDWFFEEGRLGALSRQRAGRVVAAAAGVALFAALIYEPIYAGCGRLIWPVRHEDLRPVLDQIAHKRQTGDVLYVASGSGPAVRYYMRRLPLDGLRVIWGAEDSADTAKLAAESWRFGAGDRVWVVISHDSQEKLERLLRGFKAHGEVLERLFVPPSALGWLFRLKEAFGAEELNAKLGGRAGPAPPAGEAEHTPEL